MAGHCCLSRSGRERRCALYSGNSSVRPEVPASQATTVGHTPCSVTIFTSIEANPKIALVGTPVEVAIDSGSAKKARSTSEGPSIRKRRRSASSPLAAALIASTLRQAAPPPQALTVDAARPRAITWQRPSIQEPLSVSITPSAQYRLTIRVRLDDTAPGAVGQVTGAVGEAGGVVVGVDLVEADASASIRDIVVDAANREH